MIWIFVIHKNSIQQIRKKILDTATKKGMDTVKMVSKKLIHKRDEATGEFIRNKITDMNEYEFKNC